MPPAHDTVTVTLVSNTGSSTRATAFGGSWTAPALSLELSTWIVDRVVDRKNKKNEFSVCFANQTKYNNEAFV